MSTITVPRPDVTSEEVADALRRGLGPRYNVLPGMGVNFSPLVNLRPDHPDTVVVGTGSNRLFQAQVRISHDAEETTLHVSPGGWGWPRLPNMVGVARKVREVLRDAMSLR